MNISTSFFNRHRQTIYYGVSLAVLLCLLKWLQVKYIFDEHPIELYIGAVALIFTVLGIWVATKFSRPKVVVETRVIEKQVIVEKEIYITAQDKLTIDQGTINKLGISARELEVLQLMAEGLSNQEIADRMFVSLNTIKTHSSNLFMKLDVNRRTQAVDKGKKLNIIS